MTEILLYLLAIIMHQKIPWAFIKSWNAMHIILAHRFNAITHILCLWFLVLILIPCHDPHHSMAIFRDVEMPAEVSLTQALFQVKVTATLLVKHYIMTHGHNFDNASFIVSHDNILESQL